MADLTSEQFKDVRFRVYHDPKEETVAVAALRVPPGSTASGGMLHETRYEPLGSIQIQHPTSARLDANRNQQSINDPERPSSQHDIVAEPLEKQSWHTDMDQLRWAGGNMDPHHSEVGWAGVRNVPGKGRIIQGLAALAVSAHGALPVADSSLSQHGARLARGMSRKYGMEGHPRNPEMGAQFNFDPVESERTAKADAVGYWRRSDSDIKYEPKSWSEYGAADVAHIAKGVDEDYRVQKRPDRVPVHKNQQKLF